MKSETSRETETDRHTELAEADGMLAAMEATEDAVDGVDAPVESTEGATETVEPTGPYLKGLIEAVLFVSDHPLELKDVARAARIDRARAQELLEELGRDYEARGIRLELVAGGYAFRSSPDFAREPSSRRWRSSRTGSRSRVPRSTTCAASIPDPFSRACSSAISSASSERKTSRAVRCCTGRRAGFWKHSA
jgi:segregation and condensation protein B